MKLFSTCNGILLAFNSNDTLKISQTKQNQQLCAFKLDTNEQSKAMFCLAVRGTIQHLFSEERLVSCIPDKFRSLKRKYFLYYFLNINNTATLCFTSYLQDFSHSTCNVFIRVINTWMSIIKKKIHPSINEIITLIIYLFLS